MTLQLEIQRESRSADLPADDKLREWTEAALNSRHQQVELVIRIVDEDESRDLNREYRGKARPTNVLSFPFEAPQVLESDLLGDLVICAPVVVAEASAQKKSVEAHWAHMVIHGALHLQGHDHQNEKEADEMECLEVEILSRLCFPDPYSG
ncbi:rRNA maturation RNase YbeY [Candidatus Vondammii sp. HM_W22]|uniref:rRNA maturation RNase YbeY n=1 Tax=Candidatus Vondammii sp. HM_W22 TaxID=2687299 RepID=UPI001F13BFF1|nr:rRNA maturation RNase YbeY [Candidatus Vondammii sp. HM_W22]